MMRDLSNIRVWVDSVDGAIEFEEILHSLGYDWGYGEKYFIRDHEVPQTPKTFVFYLEKDMFDTHSGYRGDKIFGDVNHVDDVIVLDYSKDKNDIIKFLKTKGIKPTYKPKKIYRTFEGFIEGDYEYDMIIIKILDRYELDYMSNYMKDVAKLDISSSLDVLKDYINDDEGAYIRITRSPYEYRFGPLHFLDDIIDSMIFKVEKIFTVNDVKSGVIDNILKYGKNIPISKDLYKPKKIIRESIEGLISNIPSKPLTVKEQKEKFKVGDEVYIRPDALKYFNDVDGDVMPYLLGKKGKIIDTNTLLKQYEDPHYIEDFSLPPEIIEDYHLDDLLLYVEIEGDPKSKYYFWYYRCLITPDMIRPTYTPKKIDRLSEAVHYDNNEDIFGKKPDILIGDTVKFREDITYYDFPIFDSHSVNFYNRFGDVESTVVAKFHDEERDIWWSHILPLENNTGRRKRYFMDSLLELPKPKPPTYKPRKIDKTYEDYYYNNDEILSYQKDNKPKFMIGDRVRFVRPGYKDLVDVYGDIGWVYKEFYDNHKYNEFIVQQKYYDDVHDVWWSFLQDPDQENLYRITESYFLDKSLDHVRPTYKPKKIIRESLDQVRGDHYYRIFTEEEFTEKFGSDWRNKHDKTWWNDNGHMENMVGKHLYHIDDEYIKNNKQVDFDDVYRIPFIHVFDETKNMNWSIRLDLLVRVRKTPTYKPRQVIRESIENVYPYKDIVIYIKDKDEFEQFHNLIKEVCAPYDMYDLLHLPFPNYFFIGVHSFRMYGDPQIIGLLSYLSYNVNINELIEEHIYSDPRVNDNIFTIRDLETIRNILEHGVEVIKPTYKPKKIDRLTESNQRSYIKIKTREELEEEFGENWKMINWWVVSMDRFLGMELPSEINDNFIEKNKMFHHGTGKEFIHLPPEIDRTQHLFPLTILKKLIIKPSYKPKKIIKESLSYEFKEIVIKINNENEYNEFKDFLSNLDSSYWLMGVGDIDVFPNYLFLKVGDYHKTNHLQGIILTDDPDDDMEDLLKIHVYNDYNVNNKIFTINDLSSIKNILFYGKERIPPSYKPKKISRLNESSLYFYRVKTQEELEEEFGNEWGYIIDDEYMWNSEYMDYLLGQKLDISEEDVEYAKNNTKYVIVPNDPRISGLDIREQEDWFVSIDLLTKEILRPSYQSKTIKR